jgi:hypothetical protein
MFFNRLFKPVPPRVIQVPGLGALSLKDEEWHFQVVVNGSTVQACIEDVNGSPCEEACSVARATIGKVSSLWKAAVDYTVGEISPHLPRFEVDASKFEPEAVSFHAPGAFEGGEVAFWFRIVGDRDGTYFVPLRDGVPLLWHRDS